MKKNIAIDRDSSSGVRLSPRAPRQAPRAAKVKTSLVVAQLLTALSMEHRLPTLMGFLLGGFVPVASFAIAHGEVERSWAAFGSPALYLVLGGLLFSARTVYQWARSAFGDGLKSVGFVVLAEGAMTLTSIHWVALAALCYLVTINGVATGVRLAIGTK